MYQPIPPEKQYRKYHKPAPTLLQRWAEKIKAGAPVIPVYRSGCWSVAVPRGNKNYLLIPL